ncbi:MAG: hypothetical protein LBS17_03285 [Actinomycetes bacterium]|nr:hypothetical protein [Actinomycetes bacterium]
MTIRWFKDERGSTSLAVVLAIVLVVALLACCLQWYWTASSSADIQTVADLAVLSAADTTAKGVMFVQVLDALLLTANLFGLLLHVVVMVAGVATVLGGPALSAAAGTFFEQAADFDRQYCERRKQFAQDAYKLAQVVCDASPVAAVASGVQNAAENRDALQTFSGADYTAVVIPFPLKGEITLSGYPDADQDMADLAQSTGEKNEQDAADVKRLREKADDALDAAYKLDIYKPAGTQRAYWDPASAFGDFRRGFDSDYGTCPAAPATPRPIEDNAATRAALAADYRDTWNDIHRDVRAAVIRTIATPAAGSAQLDARDISATEPLAPYASHTVLLLDHAAGARKAYHSRSDCQGLANASHDLGRIRLDALTGDDKHPPCAICTPPHTSALADWQRDLTRFARAWNAEAAALRAWQTARDRADAAAGRVRDRTQAATKQLADSAKSLLLGGRLRYTPAGARGFLCVATTTNTRHLPAFTLPALTAATDAQLGQQLTLSAARLMPAKDRQTIPDYLDRTANPTGSSATPANSGQLSGAIPRLLDTGIGVTDTVAVKLWGTCLKLNTRGQAGATDLLNRLPLGLDKTCTGALDKITATAEITAPDLRMPMPTLVDTSQIGDATAPGIEGRVVSAIASGKDAARKLAQIRDSDLHDLLQHLGEYVPASPPAAGTARKGSLLGAEITLPLCVGGQ